MQKRPSMKSVTFNNWSKTKLLVFKKATNLLQMISTKSWMLRCKRILKSLLERAWSTSEQVYIVRNILRFLKNISKRKQMKFCIHLIRSVGSLNSNFQIIAMNSHGCMPDQKLGGIWKKQNGHSQTKYKKFGRSLKKQLLKQKKKVQWHLMTSVKQPNATPHY